MGTDDGGWVDAFSHLLDTTHVSRVDDLPPLLTSVAPLVGALDLRAHVVDYAQRSLLPLGGEGEPANIDATVAGHCYRDLDVRASSDEARVHVWVPLLDGRERLGVLEAVLDETPDGAWTGRLMSLAGLVAELLTTRSAYGDMLELTRRAMPMSVEAELQWSLLPPLTFATTEVGISAVLEPCYDIGGDSFDYAVNGSVLHAAVFDAIGHGISASQMAALTVSAYRNARRCGVDLEGTAHSLDRWVSAQFPDRFVTGLLLELDVSDGTLRVVTAGHPAPLVFREGRLVHELPGPTRLPLGLGDQAPPDAVSPVTEYSLQPGDHVLVYSDGITEARTADGTEFGVERLTDFLVRALAAQQPAPETMRRLIRAILEHQHGHLQDDGTAVLVQWAGSADSAQRVSR